MNKRKKNNCLYVSSLSISQCLLGIILAFGLSLPTLWLSVNPFLSLFLTAGLLSVLFWSIFLRKSYFYQDHVIIFYPFRCFKRYIVIQYEEIAFFLFIDRSSGEFLEIIISNSSVIKRLYIKYLCSSLVDFRNKHKIMSFFFFLKYLKTEGFVIKKYSNTHTSIEERIEFVFGSGNSLYVRKSPSEKRKERRKDIIVDIIVFIIIILVCVLLSRVRYGTNTHTILRIWNISAV